MKTASFFTYRGEGRISIARYAPRNTPAGFRIFKALAPKKEMLKMSELEYRDIYFNVILAGMDPKKLWDHLYKLAGGSEPILLCWERPPFTADNWCHRRMVAEFFLNHLGEVVEEL